MGGCASMCSSNVCVPSAVRRECYTQLTKTCSTGSVSKESCVSSSTFKIKHIKSLDDLSPSTWENVNLLPSRSNQSVMMTNQGVPVLMLASFSSSYSPCSYTSTNASMNSFKSTKVCEKTQNNTSIQEEDTISKSRIPFIMIHESSSNKLTSPKSLQSLDYDYLVPDSNG